MATSDPAADRAPTRPTTSSVTEPRRWNRIPFLQATIAATLSLGTAVSGGAMGVGPDLLADCRTASKPFWQVLLRQEDLPIGTSREALLWVFVGLAVVSFATAAIANSHRVRVLARRGTAYLIQEIGDDWVANDTRAFEASARNDFASLLMVPTSAFIGDRWGWPKTSEGGPRWSRKADDLTVAFLATRHNDDRSTRDSIFLWADWPVAAALAERATRRLRNPVQLEVRQRPSTGGGGGHTTDRCWQLPGHDFRGRPSESALQRMAGTTSRRTLAVRDSANSSAGGQAVLLLVRVTGAKRTWADAVPLDDTKPTTPLTLTNTTELTLPSTFDVVTWRCDPADGSSHHWEDYPALAWNIVAFLSSEVNDCASKDVTFLLGAEMPAEVAFGVGVLLARASLRRPLWSVIGLPTGAFMPVLPLGHGGE